jgi:hypothetical protein
VRFLVPEDATISPEKAIEGEREDERASARRGPRSLTEAEIAATVKRRLGIGNP